MHGGKLGGIKDKKKIFSIFIFHAAEMRIDCTWIRAAMQ